MVRSSTRMAHPPDVAGHPGRQADAPERLDLPSVRFASSESPSQLGLRRSDAAGRRAR